LKLVDMGQSYWPYRFHLKSIPETAYPTNRARRRIRVQCSRERHGGLRFGDPWANDGHKSLDTLL